MAAEDEKIVPAPSLPWLFIRQDQVKDAHGDDRLCFYSLEGHFYKLRNIPEEFCYGNGICLGSSHGWLLFLNKKLECKLLNLISLIQLPLPPRESLPGIQKEKGESLFLLVSITGIVDGQARAFFAYKLEAERRWIKVGLRSGRYATDFDQADSIYFLNKLLGSSRSNVIIFNAGQTYMRVRKVCDLPEWVEPPEFLVDPNLVWQA